MNLDKILNKIHLAKCPDFLLNIPDESIALTLTSPPFYDDDLYVLKDGRPEFGWKNYQEYLDHLKLVIQELYRITISGGRICFVLSNSPNIDKNGFVTKYFPIVHDFVKLSIETGFLLQDEIIWEKYQPSYDAEISNRPFPEVQINPIHDWIIVCKKSNKIRQTTKPMYKREQPNSIWKLPSENKKVDKKYNDVYSSFPDQLIKNVIEFWSLPNDIVLDPYAGSGIVIKKAIAMKRKAIGIEVDPKWEYLWEKINENTDKQQ